MAISQHHVSKRSTRRKGIRSPQKLLMLLTASLLHVGIGATSTFNHDSSAKEHATGSPPTTSANVPLSTAAEIPTMNNHSIHYKVSLPNNGHTGGVPKAPRSKQENCYPVDGHTVNHVSVQTECNKLLLNLGIDGNRIPQNEMVLFEERFLLGTVSLSVGNVSTLINEDYMCKCYAGERKSISDDTCALSINLNEPAQKEDQHSKLGTHLTNLPLSSTEASYIKVLSLRNNNICNFSLNLFEGFVHLEVLDLSQNVLRTLNITQAHFPFLIKLQLSENKMRWFDSSPCNLTSLYINNNEITDLSFITKFENIVILEASHNNISTIPSYITNLKELRCINLNNNKIKNIALLQHISPKKLYRISLSYNEIEQVNIDFTNHMLKLLLLNNNNISYFNFSGVTKLIYIDLCNNRISKIEPTHPLRDSSITGLILCNNSLSNVYVMMRMEGLRTLDLSNNNLQNLDKMFVDKNYLKNLYLSNVSLQSLDFVKDLSALEVLEVDDNNITYFPKQLFQKHIKIFGLSNNPFQPVYCPSSEYGKEIMDNCNMSFQERNENIFLNITMQHKEINKKIECVMSRPNSIGKKFLNQCSSNSRGSKESLKQYLLVMLLFILNILYYDAIDLF